MSLLTAVAGSALLLSAALASRSRTPSSALEDKDERKVDYLREVRPILANYCFSCHGPDGAERAHVEAILRAAMEAEFGASDTTGAWDWKSAYEACEVATVLFLRKYGNALFRKAGSPAAALPMLAKIARLLPTHTRRSEESEALQQFSTPTAPYPHHDDRRLSPWEIQ